MNHHTPGSVRRSLTFALPLVTLAACSSSDDPAPVPNTSTAFSSNLDRAQVAGGASLGSAVRVTIRNQAPDNGTFQTPVWVAFHDGSFDIYDSGTASSAELERLAEDGTVGPIDAAFLASGAGTISGAIGGVLGPVDGPIPPGESVSAVFRMDPNDTTSRYFSWASMVIPSNDAFVANANPLAHGIFDGSGSFIGSGFTVDASAARDAGTEVNDEIPANTAFFGQAAPDTGVVENGVITVHPGFLAPGMGGILDDAMFAGGDFANVAGYEFLRFDFDEVTTIAEPTGTAILTFDEGTEMLTFEISASALSGAATSVELRSGATGQAGSTLLDLAPFIDVNADGSLTARGTTALSSTALESLRSGQGFLRVATALNPSGEIRGQIRANNAFTAPMTTAQEVTAPVSGTEVRVTIQNQAPTLGTFQTPVWVAFHDGTFDIYDIGTPASAELERIAEDGAFGPLADAFQMSGAGSIDGGVFGVGGVIAPGETTSTTFRVDSTSASSRYFSWASMVIPSNDAFVANANPMAHELFDAMGAFTGGSNGFVVTAAAARDAGTELNDEVPANTAFFGQMTPDTGVTEVANISVHPGFMTAGSGGILDDAMFSGADFANIAGYEFLSVAFRDLGTPTNGPTGVAALTLNADRSMVTVRVQASNLSGPATMLHLHNAAAGVDGPVVLDIASALTVNAGGVASGEGTFPTTPAILTAIDAGEIYVNLHTALNPAGEIRGQVNVAP